MAARNGSQIPTLGKMLEKRLKLVLDGVRDELEKSENQQYVELVGRIPTDAGDESVGHCLADLNLAIIDRHIQEVRDIDAAKSRIKDGSFGICMDCKDDISFARLTAYPTAKRCLVCQQQREKTYASGNTPRL